MDLFSNMFLCIQIFLCVVSAPLVFRIPLRRLDRLLSRVYRPRELNAARIQRIIRYTDLACEQGRGWVPRYCLARGLALLYMLRREGLPVSLVFGIRQTRTACQGHCWLTLNGEPYAERIDPRADFISMYHLGTPAVPH
jgi:hypothetical protein